jgi:hypothetical protein
VYIAGILTRRVTVAFSTTAFRDISRGAGPAFTAIVCVKILVYSAAGSQPDVADTFCFIRAGDVICIGAKFTGARVFVKFFIFRAGLSDRKIADTLPSGIIVDIVQITGHAATRCRVEILVKSAGILHAEIANAL